VENIFRKKKKTVKKKIPVKKKLECRISAKDVASQTLNATLGRKAQKLDSSLIVYVTQLE
jgi:hypothetical protein